MKSIVGSACLLHHVRGNTGKRRFGFIRSKQRHQLTLNRRQLLPHLCDSVSQQLCSGHVVNAAMVASTTAGQSLSSQLTYHSLQEFTSSWDERAPLSPVRHFGFPVAACRVDLANQESRMLSYSTQRVFVDDNLAELATSSDELTEKDIVSAISYSVCCYCRAEATILAAKRAVPMVLSTKSAAKTDLDSPSRRPQLLLHHQAQKRACGKASSRKPARLQQQRPLHRRRLNQSVQQQQLEETTATETWDLPSSTDASLAWQLLLDQQANSNQQAAIIDQSPDLSNSTMETQSNCKDTAASMDSAFFTCSGVAPLSPLTLEDQPGDDLIEIRQIQQSCLTQLDRIRSILTTSELANLTVARIRTCDQLLGQIDSSLRQSLPDISEADCDTSNPSMATLTCVDLAAADNLSAATSRKRQQQQQQQKQQQGHRRQRSHLFKLMGLTRRRRLEVDSTD
ncbi:hypothetical protein BOX15_Mlig026529g1 [Macrostomum lignano]|uniref:Uncharacterized protein n=1 Tax=Macrostomum lignano TaxID=282301 RepID=A0A267GXV1_9PLAT|nr:hypothetical protein BOX15_Mlig026529g1 [Macrostomum lignano]